MDAVVFYCGDCVFCLVVADHTDFAPAGLHQGDNLPWSLHKRLAFALEPALTGWVDHLDHSASLSIEEHPITEELVSSAQPEPAKDGDFVGVDLAKEGP